MLAGLLLHPLQPHKGRADCHTALTPRSCRVLARAFGTSAGAWWLFHSLLVMNSCSRRTTPSANNSASAAPTCQCMHQSSQACAAILPITASHSSHAQCSQCLLLVVYCDKTCKTSIAVKLCTAAIQCWHQCYLLLIAVDSSAVDVTIPAPHSSQHSRAHLAGITLPSAKAQQRHDSTCTGSTHTTEARVKRWLCLSQATG